MSALAAPTAYIAACGADGAGAPFLAASAPLGAPRTAASTSPSTTRLLVVTIEIQASLPSYNGAGRINLRPRSMPELSLEIVEGPSAGRRVALSQPVVIG